MRTVSSESHLFRIPLAFRISSRMRGAPLRVDRASPFPIHIRRSRSAIDLVRHSRRTEISARLSRIRIPRISIHLTCAGARDAGVSVSRIHIRASQSAIDNFGARDLVELDIADSPTRQGPLAAALTAFAAPFLLRWSPDLTSAATGHPQRPISVPLYLYVSHCTIAPWEK